MLSCVVKWCKNNTTSQKKCQGITFHRFPTGNEPWKDDWTRIIRNCKSQEDWSASKSSVVCSIHFDQNDLYTTSKGRRRLVTYATRIKFDAALKRAVQKGDVKGSKPLIKQIENHFTTQLSVISYKYHSLTAESSWIRAASNLSTWKLLGEAYVHRYTIPTGKLIKQRADRKLCSINKTFKHLYLNLLAVVL
ncbi:hypothetical protein ABMA27_014627 [Loxostege sticticalis]|uniref:THAP-type domain-containing protein n=1 Tax=Loxostege sticticalis TaxID=481309 RepID=A0ABR3I9M2_LOXSC